MTSSTTVYLGGRRTDVLDAALIVGGLSIAWPGLVLVGLVVAAPFVPDPAWSLLPPGLFWLFWLTPIVAVAIAVVIVLVGLLSEHGPSSVRLYLGEEEPDESDESLELTPRDAPLLLFLVLTVAASGLFFRTFQILHGRVEDDLVDGLLLFIGLPFATALGVATGLLIMVAADLLSWSR
ncbi:MAG TPA: hypothetical protein VLA22_11320 [Gaiellaceae bacterium]|nr:hypothetical protein [Gaiellaceae bacterium]